MIEAFITWLVHWVHSMGYLGLFIMTLIESTFVPIPAEITVIPAGYLVQQGHMHAGWVLFYCATGMLMGSLINYAIAYYLGRKLIIRYGRYFFMNEEKLAKIDAYFIEHGGKSTLIGRLLPGVKHYISFPAGLGRMRLDLFCLYTTLGGTAWIMVLLAMGYYLGENEALVKQYVLYIKFALLGGMAAAGAWLWYRWQKRRKHGA
jgi:membrane protein DedA with SNARE-associated domain